MTFTSCYNYYVLSTLFLICFFELVRSIGHNCESVNGDIDRSLFATKTGYDASTKHATDAHLHEGQFIFYFLQFIYFQYTYN